VIERRVGIESCVRGVLEPPPETVENGVGSSIDALPWIPFSRLIEVQTEQETRQDVGASQKSEVLHIDGWRVLVIWTDSNDERFSVLQLEPLWHRFDLARVEREGNVEHSGLVVEVPVAYAKYVGHVLSRCLDLC
jgi:hypothetical protein